MSSQNNKQWQYLFSTETHAKLCLLGT